MDSKWTIQDIESKGGNVEHKSNKCMNHYPTRIFGNKSYDLSGILTEYKLKQNWLYLLLLMHAEATCVILASDGLKTKMSSSINLYNIWWEQLLR